MIQPAKMVLNISYIFESNKNYVNYCKLNRLMDFKLVIILRIVIYIYIYIYIRTGWSLEKT